MLPASTKSSTNPQPAGLNHPSHCSSLRLLVKLCWHALTSQCLLLDVHIKVLCSRSGSWEDLQKRHWWRDMGRFTLVLNWHVSFSAKNAHHKVHSIHPGLPEVVHKSGCCRDAGNTSAISASAAATRFWSEHENADAVQALRYDCCPMRCGACGLWTSLPLMPPNIYSSLNR